MFREGSDLAATVIDLDSALSSPEYDLGAAPENSCDRLSDIQSTLQLRCLERVNGQVAREASYSCIATVDAE